MPGWFWKVFTALLNQVENVKTELNGNKPNEIRLMLNLQTKKDYGT